jgi:hypothetical protein
MSKLLYAIEQTEEIDHSRSNALDARRFASRDTPAFG